MLSRVSTRAAVLGAGLALACAAVAGADTQTHHPNMKKDGSVWLVRADGHVCKIFASRNLDSSTCLNANLVRVENHGYTSGVGGKVNARLYYNQSFQNGGHSAYACISPQDRWTKGPGGVTVHFDHLDGKDVGDTGLGKPIWSDVARVVWSATPCV